MSPTRLLRLTSLASRPSLPITYRAQAQLTRPAALFQARHYAAKGEGEQKDRGGPGHQWPSNPHDYAGPNSYLGVVHGLGGYTPDLHPRTQRSLTILNCVAAGMVLLTVSIFDIYQAGKKRRREQSGRESEQGPEGNA